jgi:D-threo-aldose 1-dehydrogenase
MSLPFQKVGKTDLAVTRIGFGAAPISWQDGKGAETKATDCVRAAWSHGIRFIDTAPAYGLGKRSELWVGMGIDGLPRSEFVLETKVRRIRKPGEGVPPGQNNLFVADYTRDSILRSIENSLERLKTDRIDILLIHDPDTHYQEALDQAFPTLEDLRSEGVIRAIGAGMNQWKMPADFIRNADPDCFLLASRYTLLDQGALEFLDLCQERSVSVFLGGVFNTGILVTGAVKGAKYFYRDAPDEILGQVGKIEAVCKRYQVPLPAAAIQFSAAHPAVAAVVLGMSSSQEVEEDVRLWEWKIPKEFWEELRAEKLIDEKAPTPWKHPC